MPWCMHIDGVIDCGRILLESSSTRAGMKHLRLKV